MNTSLNYKVTVNEWLSVFFQRRFKNEGSNEHLLFGKLLILSFTKNVQQ